MATKKNEAKIKFTADTGEFNESIRQANNKISEMKAELKLNDAQMESTGTTVDGLKKKHELLKTELEAASTKTEALSGKLESAVTHFGENSTEASKLRTQLANAKAAEEKLKNAVSNCENELNTQETALDNTGDAAQDAGQQAEDSSGGWTILKDVIADMASSAVQWAAEKFKELLTAADDALATLSARTGATTDEMANYESVMESIYTNNYGESFEDIADAVGVVTQTLGDMDDADLQNVTESAITLRDTFGYDYQEQMRAVNALTDQFGITSDEAFNLIAQGAQNGLDQNGDLLDTINEYSVQFKTAGYDADDMFNMLKNGVDSGTWSVDKLGDAVKEFNIRAKDGTAADALKEYRKKLGLSSQDVKQLSSDMKEGGTKGQEAYSTILEALMGVEDETQRYQIGVELFGTMWEDLGENTMQSLMNTQGELSKTKTAMDDMKNTKYDTLSSAWQGLGRSLETSIIKPLTDTLAPIAKDIVQWLIDHMDVIAPIITGIATAVGVLATALAIQGLIKGVTTAFTLLNTVMSLNPAVLIAAAIAGVVAVLIYLWNNCEGFRNFCIGLWEAIKEIWNGICTAMTTAIENAKVWLSAAWESIKTTVSNTWESIKTAVSTAIEAVSTTISTVWEAIKTTTSTVWDAITNTISTIVNGVKTTITNVWNGIKLATSSVFNAIKNSISTAITNAKTTVTLVITGIKTTITSVFDSIKTKATEVWNGIKDAISTPIEAAKETVKNVIDAIKGFFDFEFTWPKLKLPHFNVSGGQFPWGIMGEGTKPTISVDWYAEGGILTKPTVFGINGSRLMAGGEAGAEAILPIDRLEGYIQNAIERSMNVVSLDALADAIEDLASRPNHLYIGSREIAVATAGDSDNVNGLRTNFKNRGLVL